MHNALTYISFCKMSYFFTGMRKQAIIMQSEKIQTEEDSRRVAPISEECDPLSEKEKRLLTELFNLFIESYEWNRTTTDK